MIEQFVPDCCDKLPETHFDPAPAIVVSGLTARACVGSIRTTATASANKAAIKDERAALARRENRVLSIAEIITN